MNNYIVREISVHMELIVGPNSVIKNNVVTNTNRGISRYGTTKSCCSIQQFLE